jgi:hypothetical protein
MSVVNFYLGSNLNGTKSVVIETSFGRGYMANSYGKSLIFSNVIALFAPCPSNNFPKSSLAGVI